MKKKLELSEDKISDLIARMEQLPPKPNVSGTAQVLSRLEPAIKKLFSRGYNVQDIASFLEQESIKISARKISELVPRKRKRKEKANPCPSKKEKGEN